jgi:hypothetical protein
VAVVIACVLALSGVVWAVRAAIRSRRVGPPAWRTVLLAAAALLAVPVGAAGLYLLLPVPVTETTLSRSIQRETGSAPLYSALSCVERRANRWRCSVPDSSGSGLAKYAVTAGDQCWHATLRNDDFEGRMPVRPDGCATLRDAPAFDY